MLRFRTLALGAAWAAACLAQARAQDVTTTTTTTTAPVSEAPGEMRRASQILGSTVQLQGTDNFGKVEDIILGDNGGPSYLVVSNGGKFAMFPWNGANINYGRRVVAYDVAPTAVQPLFFERNAWPRPADTQYLGRVTRVFPAGAPGRVKVKVRPDGTIKEKIR